MSTKRHVISTVLSRTGGTALAALTAIVIARDLGASALGLYGLLRAVPTVLLLFTEFGVAAATPYLVNQRGYSDQSVVSMTLGVALVVGVFDTAIWNIAAPVLGEHLFRGLSLQWIGFGGPDAAASILIGFAEEPEIKEALLSDNNDS